MIKKSTKSSGGMRAKPVSRRENVGNWVGDHWPEFYNKVNTLVAMRGEGGIRYWLDDLHRGIRANERGSNISALAVEMIFDAWTRHHGPMAYTFAGEQSVSDMVTYSHQEDQRKRAVLA